MRQCAATYTESRTVRLSYCYPGLVGVMVHEHGSMTQNGIPDRAKHTLNICATSFQPVWLCD